MQILDIFAGLGGASAAFMDRGWDVVTVDNDPRFDCTHTADLSTWSASGLFPDLIWASPPCTEFSRESMPWCRTGQQPSTDLVMSAVRIIAECKPRWWVIENVRGARKWLHPILGDRVLTFGPFFLWGCFPQLNLPRYTGKSKEKWGSVQKAERARIPYELSNALAFACESTIPGL